MKFPKSYLFAALLFVLAYPVLADFGCHFIVNSRLSYTLDNSQKKISFRFTCQQDMDVVAASVFCEKALNAPSYLISIHEDEAGSPSEESMGETSIIPQSDTWATLPMMNVPLAAGKVYHLVVEWDANRGGIHPVGVIGPQNYASFAFTDKPNHMNPYAETSDPKLEVLTFEKGGWKKLGRQPLYAVSGGGQIHQGDPYDSHLDMPIHGNGTPDDEPDDILQGEALHPHCGVPATGFAVRVKKAGNPASPLNYRVYTNDYMKHITKFSFSGKALDPNDAGEEYQWVTVGFEAPKTTQSFQPQCTYIAFQTDSGRAGTGPDECEDCYVLSGAKNSGNLSGASELTFDAGAHYSRAAYSVDGGATFLDEFEADANLILLGPPCQEQEEGLMIPIPAPSPLPGGLNP